MELTQKRIFIVLSPHMNYYHSFRGDSEGRPGFGLDCEYLADILAMLEKIDQAGLNGGQTHMCWDFADTHWTIPLQQKYQPEVLQKIIARCRNGQDEVLIGSWSNSGQPLLDTEEIQTQHRIYMRNSDKIGLEQLFPNAICPFARTQETMYTQGMIEQYNKLGVKGICLYYSTIPFDSARPFLYPRLDMNQQYGLVKLKSSVSNAEMLMLPSYNLADVLDFKSLKELILRIRKKQETGEIAENALLFLNFDMDVEAWTGLKLPKALQWLPNSRGLYEIYESVEEFPFAEITTLDRALPNIKVWGETTLYPDVADGCFNGFYNWAQKFNNTRFWTLAQYARWYKCLADTLISPLIGAPLRGPSLKEIQNLLRSEDLTAESYMKNHLLLSSTTNFGMSVPFIHPNRRVTTLVYANRAFEAAKQAFNIALNVLLKTTPPAENQLVVIPLMNRGNSDHEKWPLIGPCVATIPLSKDAALKQAFRQHEISINSPIGGDITYQLIGNELVVLISGYDNQTPAHQVPLLFSLRHTASQDISEPSVDGGLSASKSLLRNQHVEIKFDANGKITSFQSSNRQFSFQSFLDSAVRFGSIRYASEKDEIDVLQDGSDGFTASVRMTSKFSIDAPNLNAPRGNQVIVEKTLTLYRDVPSVYVSVKMQLPEISGTADSTATTSSVRESYDLRWQDIIPAEVTLVHPENNSFYRIWKHNFMGITSYYDLNMKDVDAKNANIDVLSSSVSDGWLGVSDPHQGLLIGFNSLKAANFAFSPLKIVEIQKKPGIFWQQQVSINPFGTYYGRMLHHWTDGSGHGQVFSSQVSTTFRPTAPSFSGKTLEFDLLISPFIGSKPNVDLITRHAHFNLPPYVAIRDMSGAVVTDNTEGLAAKLASISEEVGLTPAVMQMDYLEWVEHINRTQPEAPKKGGGIPPLKGKTILNIIIDSIRAKKPKRLIK